MMRSSIVILSVVLCALALPIRYKNTVINAKELAGPVSEFTRNQLPLPEEVSQIQTSSFVAVMLNSANSIALAERPQSVLWEGPIVVDSAIQFQFSFLSPNASMCSLSLTDPLGNTVSLADVIQGVYAIGGTNVPETTWSFLNATLGTYTLTISSTNAALTRASATDDETPFAHVITNNLSPLSMVGHLSTYYMQQGEEVGLVALVLADDTNGNLKSLTPAAIRSKAIKNPTFTAIMYLVDPSGVESNVSMHDDGLHGDFEADDGVWGALVDAAEVGIYQAQAEIKGKLADGTAFIRTTQHLITSVPDEIDLMGTAVANMTSSNRMSISLAVLSDSTMHPLDQTFRAYAEVWGQSSNGSVAAACWIAGITQITNDNSSLFVDLNLDLGWLTLAEVSLPLVLKNVILQETESWVPLSQYTSIEVEMSPETESRVNAVLAQAVKVAQPTREMKEGVMPAALLAKKAQATTGDGAILLVHGYCSSTNPFETSTWTNPYFFLRDSASDTHDDFAKYVITYAEEQGLSGYSMVGHSQGGIVSAHIKNFYFSGMDIVGEGRKIQSIGTPYEGCTAAGSSASLGKSFGIGCGTNFDLSLDGSRLWEPSITTDTRAEIYYYTTTYKQGNLFGDSCSMAMNAILQWPNDGTAELEYTDIAGANNMGNTQKQCHTTSMNYMPQYQDTSRNAIMNTAAAR